MRNFCCVKKNRIAKCFTKNRVLYFVLENMALTPNFESEYYVLIFYPNKVKTYAFRICFITSTSCIKAVCSLMLLAGITLIAIESAFNDPFQTSPKCPFPITPSNVRSLIAKTPFFRTRPLLYLKFENIVIFRSGNLYSLCSPGNQDNQQIIQF